VQRPGLDVLVAGERVGVGAAVEQESRGLDASEETGEPERLKAVVAERVRRCWVFVQQREQPVVSEGGSLEDVELRPCGSSSATPAWSPR